MANAPFTLPDTISGIDARLAFLQEETIALKRKRNELTPLFRLPPEILAEIITIYAHQTHLPSLSWTTLMRVCQSFQKLALAQHPLWSHIDLNSHNTAGFFVETHIQNAGSHPLTVTMDLTDNTSTYIASWTMGRYSAQLGSLEISGHATILAGLLQALVQYPLGALRSLNISPRHRRALAPGTVMAFPDVLLRGHLPSLRALSLSGIPVSWSLLHDLETLSLTDCRDTSAGAVSTVADLLRLFQLLPTLRSLTLSMSPVGDDFLLSPFVDSSLQLRGRITAPQLGYLSLRADAVILEMLLEYIQLPANCTVDLFPHGIITSDELRPLLVPIRTHLQRPTAPPRKVLALYLDTPIDIGIYTIELLDTENSPPGRAPAVVGPGQEPDHHFTGRFSLEVHPVHRPMFTDILVQFLHVAQAGEITHLDASCAATLDELAWFEILPLLPALESIRFPTMRSREDAFTAVAALEALAASATTTQSTQIHTLHLRLLESESEDIHRDVEQDSDSDAEGAWLVSFLNALYRYARLRRKAWADNPSLFPPLTLIEIEDDRLFLYSDPHKRTMERIWRRMAGMGIVKRGGREWDPVEEKRLAREWRKEALAKLDPNVWELPADGELNDDDSDVAELESD
ncbi:F-box domain-containing protein [Mycena chlorophos]|uniref:F-box domain-containing protein n=1 Tax=Mycena chlorophos TaxID=658473 RepID=A0A8H6SB64_MYCCL|nr:F-box domain-containing protein [Mycena chlorophos]